MSEEHRQRLSELQDGELAEDQVKDLLEAVVADPELRACWERYTLIGQALRGEGIDPGARILAKRVRVALRAEPPILKRSRIYPLPHRARSRLVVWALAASVALVAMGAVPLLQAYLRPTASPPLAIQLSRPSPALQRWQLERPELASKLDRYLVTHQAMAPATPAQGFLPYVVLVSETVGR